VRLVADRAGASWPGPIAGRSSRDVEALDRLPGARGDELEVLVETVSSASSAVAPIKRSGMDGGLSASSVAWSKE
jgi:hypothetical protein